MCVVVSLRSSGGRGRSLLQYPGKGGGLYQQAAQGEELHFSMFVGARGKQVRTQPDEHANFSRKVLAFGSFSLPDLNMSVMGAASMAKKMHPHAGKEQIVQFTIKCVSKGTGAFKLIKYSWARS